MADPVVEPPYNEIANRIIYERDRAIRGERENFDRAHYAEKGAENLRKEVERLQTTVHPYIAASIIGWGVAIISVIWAVCHG